MCILYYTLNSLQLKPQYASKDNPTTTPTFHSDGPSVWRCDSRQGFVLFLNCHTTTCYFSCEQWSATPWMPFKESVWICGQLSPLIWFVTWRPHRHAKDRVLQEIGLWIKVRRQLWWHAFHHAFQYGLSEHVETLVSLDMVRWHVIQPSL